MFALLDTDSYQSIASHNAGSPICSLDSIHLATSIDNFKILEHLVKEADCFEAIVTPPVEVKDGAFKIPEEPGIGTTLSYKEVEKLAVSIIETDRGGTR